MIIQNQQQVTEAVLGEVQRANDPRFRQDEELRMAVAVHPRVSLSTAEKVTADFKVPQIKKLLAKPGLSQVLREKLFRRTTQR